MNRKIIVFVCIVLAAIFTLLISRSNSAKYAELRRTVDVVKVTQFIPAGSEIRTGQVEAVKIPEAVGKDFAVTVDQVVGNAAKVSMVEGQYVFPNSVGGAAVKQDMIEVDIPVDLSASAAVVAGDTVDVFAVGKGQQEATSAVLLWKGARVLHSYDSNGTELSPAEKKSQVAGPPGAKVPASVGLEVVREVAPAIVQAASQKRIYLAKTNPAG